MHLTTSLRSTAKSSFGSCSLVQRNNYTQLVAELKKRFTLVQLPAIQTQMYHDRKEGPLETVDDFAQELGKLYAKAYAAVTRGTPEAEQVGQTVLANQFVTGLRPEQQTKGVGMEGGMDRLVLMARFEEAKSKELTAAKSLNSTPKRTTRSTPSRTTTSTSKSSGSSKQTTKTSTREKSAERNGTERNRRKYYNCGLEGHMARACPYSKPGGKEATGQHVSRMTGNESENTTSKKKMDDAHPVS